MKQHKFTLKSLAIFLLLITGCAKDDSLSEDILLGQEIYETVSTSQVFDLLKPDSSISSARETANSAPFATPNLDLITQEELINTNAFVTIVPATIPYDNIYSRILLLNVNGEMLSVLFNMVPDQEATSDKFTGDYIITNLDGEFINGYKVENGLKVSQYLLSTNSSTTISSRNECEGITCGLVGDEILIIAIVEEPTVYISPIELSSGGGGGSTTGGETGGGGSSGGAGGAEWDPIRGECGPGYAKNADGDCVRLCPDGQIADKNGNCVNKPCDNDPIKDPKIAPQNGSSGTKGALYGCTRYGGSCSGEDGRSKSHAGIDLKNEFGEPIFAMHDGLIYSSKYDADGAGYYTRIQGTLNGQNVLTEYFHLQKDNRIEQNRSGEPLVRIKAGDIIGYQGDSGNLKGAIASGGVGSHVHIEIRAHDGSTRWGYKNFILKDPRDYISTTINDSGTSETNDCN